MKPDTTIVRSSRRSLCGKPFEGLAQGMIKFLKGVQSHISMWWNTAFVVMVGVALAFSSAACAGDGSSSPGRIN